MNVDIPCPCPPKADGSARHESDTVTLRDTLDFRKATAIRNGVAFAKLEDEDLGLPEIMAILTEGYVLHGVEAWTFTDEKGKAIPVNKPAIRERLLANATFADPIGDAADALYAPVILLPLVAKASTSSPPTPTAASTSRKKSGQPEHQKPSKPSSTSTTATGGTATITSLHAGGSNSSPKSATAA